MYPRKTTFIFITFLLSSASALFGSVPNPLKSEEGSFSSLLDRLPHSLQGLKSHIESVLPTLYPSTNKEDHSLKAVIERDTAVLNGLKAMNKDSLTLLTPLGDPALTRQDFDLIKNYQRFVDLEKQVFDLLDFFYVKGGSGFLTSPQGKTPAEDIVSWNNQSYVLYGESNKSIFATYKELIWELANLQDGNDTGQNNAVKESFVKQLGQPTKFSFMSNLMLTPNLRREVHIVLRLLAESEKVPTAVIGSLLTIKNRLSAMVTDPSLMEKDYITKVQKLLQDTQFFDKLNFPIDQRLQTNYEKQLASIDSQYQSIADKTKEQEELITLMKALEKIRFKVNKLRNHNHTVLDNARVTLWNAPAAMLQVRDYLSQDLSK